MLTIAGGLSSQLVPSGATVGTPAIRAQTIANSSSHVAKPPRLLGVMPLADAYKRPLIVQPGLCARCPAAITAGIHTDHSRTSMPFRVGPAADALHEPANV